MLPAFSIGHGFIRRVRKSQAPDTGLLFQTDLQVTGVSNLSQDITINGQIVSPTFRYEGKDANDGTWEGVVGGTFTLAGTDPEVVQHNRHAPFTDDTRAVLFPGSNTYYGSTDANLGDPGTDDFIVEMIVRGSIFAGTKTSAGTGVPGWLMTYNAAGTGRYYFYCADGTGTSVAQWRGISGTDEWHYVVGVKTGTELTIFVDGQAATAVSSAALGSVVGGTNLFVRSTSSSGDIALYAMYQRPQGWLSGVADVAALVAERFAKLTGIYPQVAKGTATPTFTRSTGAVLDIRGDDGVTRLFQVPAGWPRICQRPDADGVLRRGYLSERQATNLILYSNDFTQAAWVKSNTNVILNAAPGPLGDLFGLANTAPGSFIEQTVNVTAVAHTLSFVVKAGVDSVIGCGIRGDQHTAEFDLSNGTVISTASATARIRPWGDGRYRCEMTFTPTAGSATVGIGSLTTGDGVTPNIYLGLIQLETSPTATSYIPTTTSAATRNGDILSYVGDDGNATYGTGAIGITMLASPPYPGSWFYTLSLYRSDDGAHIATRGNDANLRFLIGANTSNSILNQFDEKQHRVGLAYEEGDVQRYHNGEHGAPLGWTGIPTGVPDRIWIGLIYSGVSQPNAILSNVKLYNKKEAP